MTRRAATQAVQGLDLTHIAADLRSHAVERATLSPAPNNARRHALDKDIPVLAESLRRFGQRKPVVAKRSYRGVANAVLAGNGTVLAAETLGWTHVAVSWLPDDMDDDTAQEYALVDNRTAELSEWDLQELSAQLRQVQERGGADGLANLGWAAHEAAPLIAANWTPAPVSGSLPGREVHWRSMAFSLGQWLVLELAIQRVQDREHDPGMSEGRAIELLAADYLSGPPPEDHSS